jgi:copper(I)-binding protein
MLPRRKLAVWLIAMGAVAAVSSVHAHGVSKGDLTIDHPYATPSLKGTTNVSAYFRGIQNKGSQVDRITSATSTVAQRVAMHRMSMQGNVMQMREVSAIDLPPNSTTLFRHDKGEYHLMLMGLKQPLKNGDRFDVTLTFERAGTQTVNVWVQTPRDAESEEHKH